MAYPFGDIDSVDVTKALINVGKNARFRSTMAYGSKRRRYGGTRQTFTRNVRRRGPARRRTRRSRAQAATTIQRAWRRAVKRRRDAARRKHARHHARAIVNRIPRQVAAKMPSKVVTFRYMQEITLHPDQFSYGVYPAIKVFCPLNAKAPDPDHPTLGVRADYTIAGRPVNWDTWAIQFKRFATISSAIQVKHWPQQKNTEHQDALGIWGVKLMNKERYIEAFNQPFHDQYGMEENVNTVGGPRHGHLSHMQLRERGLIGDGIFISHYNDNSIDRPRVVTRQFQTRRWFGSALSSLQSIETNTERSTNTTIAGTETARYRLTYTKENDDGAVQGDVNNDYAFSQEIREKTPTFVVWCACPLQAPGGAAANTPPQRFRVILTYKVLLMEPYTLDNTSTAQLERIRAAMSVPNPAPAVAADP